MTFGSRTRMVTIGGRHRSNWFWIQGTHLQAMSLNTIIISRGPKGEDGGAGGGDLSQTDIDTLAKLNGIVADATLIDTGDARLSDARTPTAHNQTLDTITDAGTAAAADVGDFATAAQGTKADSALQSGGPLGTPASGTLTNCTFPTLNQSTTGNAATATALETGRTINGVTFDGSQSITVGCLAVDVTGTLSLAQGGTSSTTASGARTNLGLGTADAVTHGSLTTTGTVTANKVYVGDPTPFAGSLTVSGSYGRTDPSGAGVACFIQNKNSSTATRPCGLQIRAGVNGYSSYSLYAATRNNNPILLAHGNGNVGIGIAPAVYPAEKLDVVGNIKASGTVKTGGYTVATLPTPSTGMRCYVTDSNRSASTHFGSTVIAAAGGTSYTVPVFYDGTDWIIA